MKLLNLVICGIVFIFSNSAVSKNLDCSGEMNANPFHESMPLKGDRFVGVIVKKIGAFDFLAIARDNQIDLIRILMGPKEVSNQGGNGDLLPILKGSSKSSDGNIITYECSIK